MYLNISMECALVVQPGARAVERPVMEAARICLEFIVLLSEQERAEGRIGWN